MDLSRISSSYGHVMFCHKGQPCVADLSLCVLTYWEACFLKETILEIVCGVPGQQVGRPASSYKCKCSDNPYKNHWELDSNKINKCGWEFPTTMGHKFPPLWITVSAMNQVESDGTGSGLGDARRVWNRTLREQSAGNFWSSWSLL